MRVLLDTCTFLWIVSDAANLSATARALFTDPDNDVFLSAVSAWGIGVKHALGRLPLPEPPARFVPAMREQHLISSLPVEEHAVLGLGGLPPHPDPAVSATHSMIDSFPAA